MKKIMNYIRKELDDPLYAVRFLFRKLEHRGFFNTWSDEKYIKLLYWSYFGRKLNLINPRTFNEKIQWLKLHDHNPLYTRLVDKIEVKKVVGGVLGEKYIIPTLGVWDSYGDIDLSNLPQRFVLKCSHDSGGVYIIKDKEKTDWNKIEKKISRQLRANYFYVGREWPYKNVKPRLIAEEFMLDESKKELKDYKIFLFNGKAKFIQVDFDRFSDHHRNFYDRKWNYVPFTTLYPTNPNRIIDKPFCLNEMLEISERITKEIGIPPFVRVDLYVTEKQIYFGEITFYHGSGCERFYPDKYDIVLGKMIDLK